MSNISLLEKYYKNSEIFAICKVFGNKKRKPALWLPGQTESSLPFFLLRVNFLVSLVNLMKMATMAIMAITIRMAKRANLSPK